MLHRKTVEGHTFVVLNELMDIKPYGHNLAIAISKMLTYFGEANATKEPHCLMCKTWPKVKKSIFKKINSQTK